MARMVSLAIITVLIVALGMTFYQLIAPFLMPLFLAGLTALLAQPVFRYFMRRCKDRRNWAAFFATSTIMGAVMLPLLVATVLGVLELFVLAAGTGDRMQTVMLWAQGNLLQPSHVEPETEDPARIQAIKPVLDQCLDAVEKHVGPEVSNFEVDILHIVNRNDVPHLNAEPLELRRLRGIWIQEQLIRVQGLLKAVAVQTVGVIGRVLGQAPSLIAACGALLIAITVYALALYYFFADGPDLILAAQTLIPIEKQHQQDLISLFAASVRALVLATFLAAVGQGLATAIGMKMLGLGPFFLLLIAATLSALIPMAGTWLVWCPYAIWLFWNGRWGAGIFLTVYGIGFVGMLDNVIRTYVLQNGTRLHPLLAIISVFGGLQVMGLWGVFIGPIVACCLHALLEIFNQEVRIMSQPKPASEVPQPPPAPTPPAL